MDIHPEAQFYLAKRLERPIVTIDDNGRGTVITTERVNVSINNEALPALSDALNERDEARAKLEYVRDETTKELIKNGVIESLRAQVAAMREALPFAVAFIERNQTQKEDYIYLEKMKALLSTLKDQSNDH